MSRWICARRFRVVRVERQVVHALQREDIGSGARIHPVLPGHLEDGVVAPRELVVKIVFLQLPIPILAGAVLEHLGQGNQEATRAGQVVRDHLDFRSFKISLAWLVTAHRPVPQSPAPAPGLRWRA